MKIEKNKNVNIVEIDNLLDDQKFDIVMELIDKCNLETLEEIKNYYSNGKLDLEKVPISDIANIPSLYQSLFDLKVSALKNPTEHPEFIKMTEKWKSFFKNK